MRIIYQVNVTEFHMKQDAKLLVIKLRDGPLK